MRGVMQVSYAPLDSAHSGLWDSLAVWAEAARDPDGWRGRVLALCRQSPRSLSAFERGQVVHLVGTTAGARLFAQAKPPPSADWLSVLDANRRYAAPERLA